MQSIVKPGGDNEERRFPIVVIGASAGGLPPSSASCRSCPRSSASPLSLCTPSPRHKSLLPDLLRSRIPGLKIEEARRASPYCPAYFMSVPPASEVRIEKGAFRFIARPRQHTHLPIDELLISLSEDAPERAVAVILSGAGTDGARGVQALKTQGGTVFVQDPATAEYPDMPLAAINTGQADGIFPPEGIAGEILRFHGSGVTSAPDDRFMTPVLFDSLCQMMNERTGYHFDHYKPSVVARRVRRRMYLHGVATVNEYLKLLAGRDQEAGQLASDLLIGVTSFFRDRLAWKALHLEVTRKLVVEASATPIRVWTAACATGEEAYSVAMMLRHELDMAGSKREIQVFATDVNDRALERAREGAYPASISADLPPDYLRSYFTISEDGLSATVNKDIRQAVIFAKQDLLADPPFSRLDLIICRNLLIYLEPEAQEKCISLFHYALRPGGYLFLGNAESPGRTGNLFLTLAHKKCRIYRKAEVKQAARMPLSLPFASDRAASRQKPTPEHRQSIIHFIQAALLEEHAPAAVAINQNHDILYHNGPTNRYLHQPRGAPTQNFLELLPEKLRNRIRGGLYRATQEARPVVLRTSITVDERHKQVFIRISKLQENLFLITFREKGNVPEEEEVAMDAAAVEETAVHQLEQELAATRDDLQSHIEELKSVNEELESSNEELQAANEELETSREELQSLNEELTTVNTQLQGKIEEQEETNDDLNNFLTSTSIPTIFLDHWFRVKRFTPAMARLITLIPGDIGRPIMDMSRENLGRDLIADAQAVLDNLTPVRKELTIDGASYVRTILPYRTGDNRIEGVVITYVDITERIKAEETLRQRESRYRELVQNANSAIIRYKADGTITFFNEYAQAFFGYGVDEVLGRNVTILVPEREAAGADPRALLREIVEHPERYANTVNENVCRDGRRVWMAWTNKPISDESGGVAEILAVGSDVTELKRAEERIRHLASFPEINPSPILEVDAAGKITFCNPATQAALEKAGVHGKEPTAFLPEDMDALLRGWDRQNDVMLSREVTIGARVFDEAIQLIPGFNAARIYARDITGRKRAEAAAAESQRRLTVIVDSIADGFYALDPAWRFTHINDAALGHFNKTRDDLIGRSIFEVFPDIRGTILNTQLNRARTTGAPVHFETASILSDRIMEVHAYPGPDNITVLFRDITDRKRAEAKILRQNRVLNGISHIFQKALAVGTEKDLGRACLAVVEEATESGFGFIGEIGADGLFHDLAISDTGWEVCAMSDKTGHRRPPGSFKIDGIYGRVLQDGTGFFTNDPASHPDRIGVPEGHPPLSAFLGVPLVNEGRTIGMIGLANREGGYTGDHLEMVNAFAPAIVQAFLRKRAEDALRESEERLRQAAEQRRLALESAELGAWDYRLDTGEVFWDQRCRDMFGVPAGEKMAYTDAIARIHPEDRGDTDKAVSRAIAGADNGAYHREFRVIWPDGSLHWVASHGRVHFDGGNDGRKAVRFLGVNTDITESKADENRIAGLTRLYAVLSRVNEAIVRVRDEQSLFTEVCGIMAEVGGFPLVWIGQAEGEKVLPVASCGLEADYLRELKIETEGEWGQGPTGTCVRENRTAINDEFATNPATLPWREQARLHGFHASAAFPLRRQGNVAGAFTLYAYEPDAFDAEQVRLLEALSADVSYALDAFEQEQLRVEAEAALRKAHDELETRVRERTEELVGAYEQLVQETKGRERIEAQLRQAQKMEALGTLTGGIAHDFNNILAAIIGFTEVVRDHFTEGDRDRHHLDRVLEAGLRGRELIKRMLAFSRKTEQEKKPVLLSDLVTETVKFIRSSTPATISIRLNVKDAAGAIFADPVQVQQVVLNLCTNAVHAMREKGGTLDVEVSDRTVDESEGVRRGMKPGPYVKLAVRDTGVGISPAIMNKIYDPFFTTKKLGEGTGLGLSVVHGIVHQHEGYIFAESEAGLGSTFTVYLPMVEGELSGEERTEHPAPSGTERVLFVDDEELLAEMGRDMLEDLGYQVTVTTSSSEALELFRTDPGRFDLVITDVTMPEITGVELAREMLVVRPDIPIIMCTGFSHLVDADAAKAAGVRAFTMKPLTKAGDRKDHQGGAGRTARRIKPSPPSHFLRSSAQASAFIGLSRPFAQLVLKKSGFLVDAPS